MPTITTGFLDSFVRNSITRWPDAIALDIPAGNGVPERILVTYREFGEKVDALGALFEKHGVVSGSVVVVMLPRTSVAAYTAPIAAMERGASWVSIDPSFPDSHVERILQDAEPVVIITDSAGKVRCAGIEIESARVIDTTDIPLDLYPSCMPDARDVSDLAYMIYTSGTTGKPKGVMITHAGIANLVRSDLDYFDLKPGDRIAQGSSHSYDSSLEEIWMAFASGATVVVMDDHVVRLGPDLVPWLREERITVICPPPTLLRTMGCENPCSELPDLRLVYVGGEALPRDVVDTWAPGRTLVNGYGPTECTVTALRARIQAGGQIVVGHPVDGISAWILDEHMRTVPDGESGELCLGGYGVASGYRNSPATTAEKFIDHPEFGRIFRTGDLARQLPDGSIDCLGRIDAQVKLRGYRIELEAIEAELVQCSGVREAACRIQGPAGREELAAWIVPADNSNPPEPSALATDLANTLPFYMVPTHYGIIDTLPRTVGGKLVRESLPANASSLHADTQRPVIPPRNPVELTLLNAAAGVLGIPGEKISVDDDFFLDLGGTSLLAAKWVSLLRKDIATSSVTVRDVYEGRTIEAVAKQISLTSSPIVSETVYSPESVRQHPVTVSLFQGLYILFELVISSALAGWALVALLPYAIKYIGFAGVLLSIPFLFAVGTPLWTCVAVARSVALKRMLIGRYTAGRVPVWSAQGLRYWLVQHTVRQIPWSWFEGTAAAPAILRLLGARIGGHVHFHRGAIPLSGGWDLLDIGDDVTVSQETSLRIMDIESGMYVTAPVRLEAGTVVGVRATVAGGATISAGSILAPLAALEPGVTTGENEVWEGIPAAPAGKVEPLHPIQQFCWSERRWMVTRFIAETALGILMSVPFWGTLFLISMWKGLSTYQILERFSSSQLVMNIYDLALAASIALPVTLLMGAMLARMLGRIPCGEIPLRSSAYLRVWLTTSFVNSASTWLSGSMFWPVWLRMAGMRIGTNCEISTLIDLVPGMVEIESDTFCADGIYLACPEIRSGTVRLGKVYISRDSFFGNHAMVRNGTQLPPDILLGVSTIADPEKISRGSSWFGIPPFELPRREVLDIDRSLTYNPGPVRYTTRLIWELLRFALPGLQAAVLAVWIGISDAAVINTTGIIGNTIGLAVAGLALLAGLTTAVLILKWMLLGRVRPGVHPLWSCWCSRWDFLYIVWGLWAFPVLTPFQGTLLLNFYLRLMGMKIGRRVVLSTGFAQVVDPDMITIGDDATVSAIFQAHTFEDRVLKIDRIHIGSRATLGHGTVPLYGAHIGDGAIVTSNSVIMKEEHLLPELRYSGAPTRSTGKAYAAGKHGAQ
ncbi:MAG TPA: amino acid adenylation domain-containing protein [Spirochaetota bacterium]|nr:amino acid adenylation domain-containing protein [Spirochaetota bacterium]